MDRSKVDQRAARGAALLDQVVPAWFFRIDLETLNIRNRFLCILGQLFGDYLDGRSWLFGDVHPEQPGLAAQYGFTLSTEEYLDDDGEYLDDDGVRVSGSLLKNAWVEEIDSRQKVGA